MSYYSTESEEHKENIAVEKRDAFCDDLGYTWDEYMDDIEDLEAMAFNDSVREKDEIHQILMESEL